MNTTQEMSTGAAATSVTVLGVVTGLSYDMLLAGFAGGLVALSFIGPMSVWRRIWSVIAATLTAGYTAPSMAVATSSWLTFMDVSPVFAAFWIGVLGQSLIPVVLQTARKHIRSYSIKDEA